MNRVKASSLLLLSLSVVPIRALDNSPSLDPSFSRIPFDQWLTEGGEPPFRWTVSVSKPELTFHQRLHASIEFKVDGKDLAPRRGQGQLVFFTQVTGEGGTRYQNHGVIDLDKLDENIGAATLTYSQGTFVLPGEYRLAAVILDTKSREHSAKQMTFRVPSSKKEFIPGAWKDLKPVDLLPAEDSPDSWYLPTVADRLNWGIPAKSAARIDVILNFAAPKGAGLNVFLPTIKAISQAGSESVDVNLKVLDVTGRHVLYRQNHIRELNWPQLKDSLAGKNTATVDVKALGERHRDAQFFVNEVGKSLRAMEKAPCALVVLSNPIAFDSGEDLSGISVESKSPCQVIYVRDHAPRQFQQPMMPQPGMRGRRGGGGFGGPVQRAAHAPVVDELAGTLKPLGPKIVDLATPEEMGKALAELYRALF